MPKGKTCIFRNDMPTSTYGAGTPTKMDISINRLMAAEIRFLRCIEGKAKRERIRN
jgi:hypothetical protein